MAELLERMAIRKGFTLPEMLIVLGLLMFLGSLSALAGSDSYQRALAASDVERIAGALRHARTLAQAGVCALPPCDEPKAQGVRIKLEELQLFEGSEFEESRVFETIPLSGAFSVEAAEIVFLPRSGNASRAEELRMTDAYGRSRMIIVNEVGVVSVKPL